MVTFSSRKLVHTQTEILLESRSLLCYGVSPGPEGPVFEKDRTKVLSLPLRDKTVVCKVCWNDRKVWTDRGRREV